MALSGGPWKPYGLQGSSSTVEDGVKVRYEIKPVLECDYEFYDFQRSLKRPVADWDYRVPSRASHNYLEAYIFVEKDILQNL